MIISLSGFSQNSVKYPIYQYDSLNNRMMVIITVDQARRIDNDYDILELLEKAKTGCDSLTASYQIVVGNLSNVIASQDIRISDFQKLSSKNDSIIQNLNGQIKKYIEDRIKCDDLNKIKDEQIVIYQKEVRKLKTQKIVGFIGLGTFGGVSIGISAYVIYTVIMRKN
jgi:hypothetical protein